MSSARAVLSALRYTWRSLPGPLVALLLGALFFTAVMSVAARAREAAALVLLLMILGILLALPHVVRATQKRWEAFDPLVAFTAICTFGYFFRSMHLLWHEHGDLYHIPVDPLEAIDLLGVGVTLVIVGVLSFYAGYGGRLAPAIAARLPLISNAWTAKRLRFVWITFTIIGLSAYTIFVLRAGGILHIITNMEMRSEASAGAHLYYVFIRFMPMALLFRQVLLMRGQASRWMWFTFGLQVFAVIVLLGMLGSRSWAFEVLFLVLVVRHYLYRPVRARTLVITVASALIIFAVYHQYRNLTHDGVEAGELAELDLKSVDTFYTGILGGRNFDMMDNLLSLVYFTGDRFDYLEGSSYLHFFVNMVPRALWPGKPEGVGTLLVKNVYGWGFGGAPPGAIGEAYVNYSWLGIIPALLLLGFFGRLVRDYVYYARTNAFAVFVLGIGFVFVLMVTRGAFYQVGSTMMMRFAPLLIGALIASGVK
ncbi:oligosaccharide repeat unit polymerase, partial [bacterium]|nr:oligosaccharide repeat unit polymerase [bacterium]